MIEVALAEGEPRLRVPRIIEKHRPNGVNATYVPVVDLETVTEKNIVFELPGRRTLGNLRQSVAASTCLWFPDSLAQSIAMHSEHYARSRRRDTSTTRPTTRPTTSMTTAPISPGDILIFIGLIFYMGIVRLPAKRDYWRTTDLWPSHPATKFMSRDRFLFIFRHLHLVSADPDIADESDDGGDREEDSAEEDALQAEVRVFHEEDGYDSVSEEEDENMELGYDENNDVWFRKVSPLINHVRMTSLRVVKSRGRLHAVDEMMVRFLGRSAETYRIKNKPTPEGYKWFVLADSKTGYLLFFSPAGRLSSQNEYRSQQSNDKTRGLVRFLIREGLGDEAEGSVIVLDNYFTSQTLCSALRADGVGVFGTSRNRRGWPPAELGKQTRDQLFNDLRWCVDDGGTLVMRWLDNGDVLLVSTCHYPTQTVEVVRRRPRLTTTNRHFVGPVWGDRWAVPIEIPKVIHDYNFNMNGVDKADQMIAYYAASLRCRRTWLPMFFQCLHVMRVNAWILFRHVGVEKPDSHKDFVMEFAFELMSRGEKIDRTCGDVDDRGNPRQAKAPFSSKAPALTTPGPRDKKRPRYNGQKRVPRPTLSSAPPSSHTLAWVHHTRRKRCEWCSWKRGRAFADTGERAKEAYKTQYFCTACNKYFCKVCYVEAHPDDTNS